MPEEIFVRDSCLDEAATAWTVFTATTVATMSTFAAFLPMQPVWLANVATRTSGSSDRRVFKAGRDGAKRMPSHTCSIRGEIVTVGPLVEHGRERPMTRSACALGSLR